MSSMDRYICVVAANLLIKIAIFRITYIYKYFTINTHVVCEFNKKFSNYF